MSELSMLAGRVGSALKQRSHSVSVAESSAGGYISASLLSLPGASAYFLGGSVIYTRDAQKGLLGVSDEKMDGIRASTEIYALMNARVVRERLRATWGLSETGATGPEKNRYGDDAGHAWIAVAGPVERTVVVETGSIDREANMWAFARAALNLLEECVISSG